MSIAPPLSSPAASRQNRSLLAHPVFLPATICALTALLYIGTLSFAFVYDDLSQIVDNDWLTSAHYIPNYFTSHVWAFAGIAGVYWRPLFLLWLFLNRSLFGLQPAGWHATTVLMHAVATGLVFILARRLTRRRDVAAIAALFFGLHPALIESVAWISGVSDPLLAAVFIPAFLYFLDWREHHSRRGLAISLMFYVLALMAKEPAVMLLPLFALYAWTFSPAQGAEDARSGLLRRAWRSLLVTLPYLPLTVVYVILHTALMSKVDYSHSPVTPLNNLLTVPFILFSYLRLLLWPAPISPNYEAKLITVFGTTTVLVPLLFVIAVTAGFLYWTRTRPGASPEAEHERRVLRFSAAWAVLPILPVLYIKPLAGADFIHPRYLYLPCMGLVIICALVLGRIRTAGREVFGMPAPRFAIVAVIVLALAAANAAQQVHWASNLLLFSRGLQVAPHNPVAMTSLAIELGKRKQYDKTVMLLQQSLREDPVSWHTLFSLGYTYLILGRTAEAEALIDKSISLHPYDADPDQWAYLGQAELRLNNIPKAEWAVRNAIRRKPWVPRYHHALALILEQEHRDAEAAAEFRRTLQLDPSNADARARLEKYAGALPTAAR